MYMYIYVLGVKVKNRIIECMWNRVYIWVINWLLEDVISGCW